MDRKILAEKSLELHRKKKGKLEVRSKVEINSKDDLALAYSPGVAEPCKEIAADPDKIYEYTWKGNSVAVISDGSAVLGLGNIGAKASLPVMEGKAILFKEFANIDAVPICLASQDVKTNIETIKNLSPTFGGINLEDFKAPECFEIEGALQNLGIPVMHDDQHGTAIVVLAGLINSLKVRKSKKEDVKVVINGAGAAGVAIARMLLKYGFKHIIMADSKGAIHPGRKDLNEIKKEIVKVTNMVCATGLDKKGCAIGDLASALEEADVFIGVSKGGVLKKEMIQIMNKNPIIFALANPDPEILPPDAKDAGAFIVATGRSDFPNQVNNVLAFPGIFRGALDARAKKITYEMKLAAAETLASLVSSPTQEKILPDPLDKKIVPAIAKVVGKAWKDSEK